MKLVPNIVVTKMLIIIDNKNLKIKIKNSISFDNLRFTKGLQMKQSIFSKHAKVTQNIKLAEIPHIPPAKRLPET